MLFSHEILVCCPCCLKPLRRKSFYCGPALQDRGQAMPAQEERTMIKVKVDARDPALRRRIRRLVLRHRLDRRKVYCVGFDGELATVERFTAGCSGCSCDCHPGCGHGSAGCTECGFTGKRVQEFPANVCIRVEPSELRRLARGG